MAGEIIVFFIVAVVIIALIIASKKPKREMTGAERMAYESERGRITAQREFNR